MEVAELVSFFFTVWRWMGKVKREKKPMIEKESNK